MRKGVSIPINTLVMLAVAIIVLLAAVAWFMGAFGSTAQEQTYKQKFDTLCIQWSTSNCNGTVPTRLCTAYEEMTQTTTCPGDDVAIACGCTMPRGITRP